MLVSVRRFLVVLSPFCFNRTSTAEERYRVSNTAMVAKSQAVDMGQASFVAEADAIWRIPAPSAASDVNLALRITNRSDDVLRFPLDVVRIDLMGSDGVPLRIDGGRDGLKAGGPFSKLVAPGESLVISRRGRLERRLDRILRLIGSDNLGGVWYFDGLRPDRYILNFEYENHAIDPAEGPEVWIGQVRTPALEIEVQ